MYLVDTNVISEARKGLRANSGVREFFGESRANDLYVCVQTLGELRRGIEKVRLRGDLAQADKLESWFDLIVSDHRHAQYRRFYGHPGQARQSVLVNRSVVGR